MVGPMDELTYIGGMRLNPTGNISDIIMAGMVITANHIGLNIVMGGRAIDIADISEEKVVEDMVAIVAGAGKKSWSLHDQ